MTDVLETYDQVLKNMKRLGEALPLRLRDIVFPDQPLKMAARDFAAEIRSLRDSLRALVQSEDSGVHSDADWGPVCAYCGENQWIKPYEHTEDCPIRKGRELLGISPDYIKEK